MYKFLWEYRGRSELLGNQKSLHRWNAIWVGIKWYIGSEYIPNRENSTYRGKVLVKGIICSGNIKVGSLVGRYLQQNDTGLKPFIYKELL